MATSTSEKTPVQQRAETMSPNMLRHKYMADAAARQQEITRATLAAASRQRIGEALAA